MFIIIAGKEQTTEQHCVSDQKEWQYGILGKTFNPTSTI